MTPLCQGPSLWIPLNYSLVNTPCALLFVRLSYFLCLCQVWSKVVYISRLSDLFRYVPRDQTTLPEFVIM